MSGTEPIMSGLSRARAGLATWRGLSQAVSCDMMQAIEQGVMIRALPFLSTQLAALLGALRKCRRA